MSGRRGIFASPMFKIISSCIVGGVWGYFALMATENIVFAGFILILFSGLYCIYYVVSDLTAKVYANVAKERQDYKTVKELYQDVLDLEQYYNMLYKITFGAIFGKKVEEVKIIKESVKKILDKENSKK